MKKILFKLGRIEYGSPYIVQFLNLGFFYPYSHVSSRRIGFERVFYMIKPQQNPLTVAYRQGFLLFPKVIKNSDWQVAFMGCFIPPSFDNGLGLRVDGFAF